MIEKTHNHTRRPIKILLQTTIPFAQDDWSIERFSLLQDYLSSIQDDEGHFVCEVVARNRKTLANEEDDPVLRDLDRSDFDELWLFAVDSGQGLSRRECQAISRFRKRGGGILATRDHQDLGSSICTIGGIGAAHFFHTTNPEPDPLRCCPDDNETKSITWPNYHSGKNGDYQEVMPAHPVHELMRKRDGTFSKIQYFPAHPHEGAVGVPEGEAYAQVIAVGRSQTTEHPFNLAVAFESFEDEEGNQMGRGIAESSFHHFADYNWDIDRGCPSFVEEAPGDEIKRDPSRLEDIKDYVRNLAMWLAPEAARAKQ